MITTLSQKTAWRFFLSCLGACFLAGSSWGALQPRTNINPALLYWQAFSIFPDLNDTQRQVLYEAAGEVISPLEEETARMFDPPCKLIRRAATMTAPCDWGVNLADGPEMVTPNVVKLRIASAAVQLRSRVALSQGRTDDAVEEMKALLVMARSIAGEGLLVQIMVQISIEDALIQFIARHGGAWSSGQWRELQTMITGKDARVATRQAVVNEKRVFHEWMVARLAEMVKALGDDQQAAFEKGLEFWRQFDADEESERILRQESGGSGTGLVEAVRRTGELYRFMDALATASPQTWRKRQEDMEFYLANHPLARLFAPNMAKARAVELRTLSRAAMIEAAAAYQASDLEGLRQVPDPFGKGPFQFERGRDPQGRSGFTLKSALNLPDIDTAVFFADGKGLQ